MTEIKLSDTTFIALRKCAIGHPRHDGVRQPDGTWLVRIDNDVRAALDARRLPGESEDDVIQRLIHENSGRPF